jgi:hypothetical protein
MTNFNFINRTPHVITFCEGDEKVTLPKTGIEIRVAVDSEEVGFATVCGIRVPFNETTYGDAFVIDTVTEVRSDLPSPSFGVLYIVSALVRTACPERKDFVSPGRLIRDENGRPIGAEGVNVNGKIVGV